MARSRKFFEANEKLDLDNLEWPVRLSTRDTWAYKGCLPLLMLTIPTGLFVVGLTQEPLVLIPAIICACVMIWEITNDLWQLESVVAHEDYLEVGKKGRMRVIRYDEIYEVIQSSSNPPSIRLILNDQVAGENKVYFLPRDDWRTSMGFRKAGEHPVTLFLEQKRKAVWRSRVQTEAVELDEQDAHKQPLELSVEQTDGEVWPVRLSIRDDWFYRYIYPIFMFLPLTGFLVWGWFNEPFLFIGGIVALFFTIFELYKSFQHFAKVVAHRTHLEIEFKGQATKVPYTQLSKIIVSTNIGHHPIRILFDPPAEFGSSLTFLPQQTQFTTQKSKRREAEAVKTFLDARRKDLWESKTSDDQEVFV